MTRRKRSSEEVTRLINEATAQLIEESGMSALTIQNICRRAGVEYQMFYNRYPNGIESYIERYVLENDLWLGHLLPGRKGLKVNDDLQETFTKIWDSVSNNSMLRSVLRLELNDTPRAIAYYTANEREERSQKLVSDYINKLAPKDEESTRIQLALIAAGLYYLAMRKDVSNFCGIDFSNFSREKLIRALGLFGNLIVEDSKVKEEEPQE
ncbi:MAG: TetR/AcrR family transcriptional regulator [Porphyromonas sp.]|nr:TetR/AcrR family transcriptional regulator [Porphyromonas sp.]